MATFTGHLLAEALVVHVFSHLPPHPLQPTHALALLILKLVHTKKKPAQIA